MVEIALQTTAKISQKLLPLEHNKYVNNGLTRRSDHI